jgi:HEAT repeat protein
VEDASAVPPLTDLLKSDRDPAVRRAVAWALGEILG